MRFKVSRDFPEELERGLKEMSQPMAEAATKGMHQLKDDWLDAGRANIAAAGFSSQWQNTLRAEAFPKLPRASLRPSAVMHHKIPYAHVFEEGATISGKPFLWIPLSTTPRIGAGRQRLTPGRFVRDGGKLFSINRPGKPPLLATKVSKGNTRTNRRMNYGTLRRISRGDTPETMPLFFGIRSITIRKRFALREISNRFAGQIGVYYLAAISGDGE